MLVYYDVYNYIREVSGCPEDWFELPTIGGWPFYKVYGVLNEPEFIKYKGFSSTENGAEYSLGTFHPVIYKYSKTSLEKFTFDRYTENPRGVLGRHWKKSTPLSASKTNLIKTITAEEGTYPNNGIQGDFWYIKKGQVNMPPVINGQDGNIGSKYSPFSIKYTISDTDDTTFTVQENLDGINIKTFTANKDVEYSCTIPSNIFYSLPDGQHTIRIEVVDSIGNKVTRLYTFNKVYMTPKISGKDEDLGVKNAFFGVKYIVTCDNPEVSTFTIEEKIDDLILKKFDAVKNIEYAVSVQDSTFYKLENGQHTITIKVVDKGKIVVRQYTFSKQETSIEMQLSKIIDSDSQPKSILLNPEWSGIESNTVKVEVCNNAYDLSPIWEDATELIKAGKEYVFTNKAKTADKWGVNIRFLCSKTKLDSIILLKGFKAEINM